MKNKVLVIIILLLVTSSVLISKEESDFFESYLIQFKESLQSNQIDLGFPEPPNDVYFYPVDNVEPGFASLDSTLINHWQIPDNLLQNMSDEGLIVTCLNLPYFHAKGGPQSTLYPTKDKLQYAIDNFNGLQELLSRNNIHKKLKRLYITPEFRLGELGKRKSEISYHYRRRIGYLSRLLSRKEIISKFNEDELYEILDRSSLRFWKPDESIEPGYTRLLMDRIMFSLQYKPFLNYLKQKEIDGDMVFTFSYEQKIYTTNRDYDLITDSISKIAADRRIK
ncbi:MAG: hypothetical protein K9N09_08160 [Candidatus Cloacimonetes bacterium]|nr:hypothetical protein [Candidatus Cloacimonadota bacterium]MCF7868658.1 hypothetical protein [Candidatus Cloacimonadota bacterium]